MITPGLNKEKYIWIRNTSLSPFYFYFFSSSFDKKVSREFVVLWGNQLTALKTHLLTAAWRLRLCLSGLWTAGIEAQAAVLLLPLSRKPPLDLLLEAEAAAGSDLERTWGAEGLSHRISAHRCACPVACWATRAALPLTLALQGTVGKTWICVFWVF